MAAPAYGTSSTVAGGFKNGANNIAVPASVAANDIIVIAVEKEALGEGITSTNFLKPSDGSAGFDEVPNTNHALYVGYKRATGSDAGNYSVNVGGTNAWTEMACVRITGAITTGSPWDDIDFATAASGTTTPSVANTTTVADTLQLYIGTHFNGGAWATSGTTERTDIGGAVVTGTTTQAGTGTTGSKSATCTTSSERNISWLGSIKSPAGSSTSANAENAAGTGTSNQPAIAIGVNAGNAAGTGTSNDATVSTATATSASAENAAGTGTAYDATVSTVPGTNAPAGNAAATGTANNASVSIGVSAGNAAATGTANQPTVSTSSFDFPAEALGIIVKIAPGADPADDPDDWPWVVITTYVLIPDKTTAIWITRAVQQEGAEAPVAQCNLIVDNRDGRFSTRNPLGAYYPDLIRGVPLRVSVDMGVTESVRFTGRVDDLPPRWDVSENHRWVPITASGIMRRLGVGVAPLGAPVTAATAAATDLLASWPCTDRAGVSGAAEASGGPSLMSNGKVVWDGIVGPDGVAGLPNFTLGGVLSGPVPTTATATEWTQDVSFTVDQGTTTTVYPAAWDTAGTIGSVLLEVKNDATCNLLITDTSGVSQPVSTSLDLRDGTWHTVSVTAQQSGADVNWTLVVDGVTAGTGTSTTQTLARVTYLTLGDGQVESGLRSVGLARSWAAASPSVDVTDAVAGYVGETTQARHARLCLAAGVPYQVIGTGTDLMGAQPDDLDLLGLLHQIEAIDGGVLAETRDGRIGLYCRSSRENAAVALSLNHSLGHLAPPLEPDDSDTVAVNDMTARMSSTAAAGVERRVTDPAHIAKYQTYAGTPLSLNAQNAAQLTAAAGLRVWLGVYEGYRYPALILDLASNPSLALTAAALDVNDRIQVANPPTPLDETIDVLVLGMAEELGSSRWRMRIACTPYAPWDVGEIVATPTNGDSGRWLVPDTVVTAEVLDLTETGVDITSVPVFPTSAAHYPIDIKVDAEVMTVSSCSGAGPTQTLTVTRGTGGVTTTHATGRPIEILDALILTM